MYLSNLWSENQCDILDGEKCLIEFELLLWKYSQQYPFGLAHVSHPMNAALFSGPEADVKNFYFRLSQVAV